MLPEIDKLPDRACREASNSGTDIMSESRPVAYVVVCCETRIWKGGLMKKAMWWFALLVLMAVPAAAQIKITPLFIIERSKNANVVHYDARLTAEGNLDPEEPVIAHWIMLAEDGRRKKLGWIEKRKAYGFTVKPDVAAKSYTMTLVAAPEHQITIKQGMDTVRAEMVIDGRPAILEKLYINASEGFFGPTVLYIEAYGKDFQTGEMLREKFVLE